MGLVKVAALYDVHGSLPALEAVIADPRFAGAGVMVSGGDEQSLAPVLRGEVTAEEATASFESRRVGA